MNFIPSVFVNEARLPHGYFGVYACSVQQILHRPTAPHYETVLLGYEYLGDEKSNFFYKLYCQCRTSLIVEEKLSTALSWTLRIAFDDEIRPAVFNSCCM
jgi:hypothetical protein